MYRDSRSKRYRLGPVKGWVSVSLSAYGDGVSLEKGKVNVKVVSPEQLLT
jgi:hypothetical protein